MCVCVCVLRVDASELPQVASLRCLCVCQVVVNVVRYKHIIDLWDKWFESVTHVNCVTLHLFNHYSEPHSYMPAYISPTPRSNKDG